MPIVNALTHFNLALLHNCILLAAIILFIISIVLCSFSKYNWSLAALVLASLLLNILVIHLDPFLNGWDERYHILVAKNMSVYPFHPMLYVHPLLPYDYKNWTGNYTWLHKQPLFLWQMALFIKLFGASEVVARLPSALMVTGLCPVIFRIGKLVYNGRTGAIAALLLASNNFILEHVSGREGSEHNDIAFMFYVTLSIWAWLEYERSNNKWWLIGMGLFSGCAILNKWLTGLAVYAGFGFYHLRLKKDFLKHKTLTQLISALAVTIVVALPWQIFILLKYPLEARYELSYNSRHFFEAIEGHGGNALFYFHWLSWQYSSLQLLILAGIIITLTKWRASKLAVALLFIAIVVYLFYTLSATKMVSYVMVAAPLCLLLMAVAVDFILSVFERRAILIPVALLLLIFLFFQNVNFNKLTTNHWNQVFLPGKVENTLIFKQLPASLAPDYVIAFCNRYEAIDCMFYTGITAYGAVSEDGIRSLKQEGKKIAVFRNHLPDYILKDTSIYILPYDYKWKPETE